MSETTIQLMSEIDKLMKNIKLTVSPTPTPKCETTTTQSTMCEIMYLWRKIETKLKEDVRKRRSLCEGDEFGIFSNTKDVARLRQARCEIQGTPTYPYPYPFPYPFPYPYPYPLPSTPIGFYYREDPLLAHLSKLHNVHHPQVQEEQYWRGQAAKMDARRREMFEKQRRDSGRG